MCMKRLFNSSTGQDPVAFSHIMVKNKNEK
jgi:hypothetical protein